MGNPLKMKRKIAQDVSGNFQNFLEMTQVDRKVLLRNIFRGFCPHLNFSLFFFFLFKNGVLYANKDIVFGILLKTI